MQKRKKTIQDRIRVCKGNCYNYKFTLPRKINNLKSICTVEKTLE